MSPSHDWSFGMEILLSLTNKCERLACNGATYNDAHSFQANRSCNMTPAESMNLGFACVQQVPEPTKNKRNYKSSNLPALPNLTYALTRMMWTHVRSGRAPESCCYIADDLACMYSPIAI